MERVRGTMDIVPEWEFNVDTIYHRTNVERVKDRYGHEMWEYDEERFTQMEYMAYMQKEMDKRKEIDNEHDAMIIEMFNTL